MCHNLRVMKEVLNALPSILLQAFGGVLPHATIRVLLFYHAKHYVPVDL